MNPRPRGDLIALILFSVLVSARPSMAQYTAEYQTNIIDGVTSNWAGDYQVGYRNSGDVLLIQNGGVLSDSGNGYLGHGSASNVAVITGSGSVWSNQENLYVGFGASESQMIISNGGAVYDANGYLAMYGASSNVVEVAGAGSTWWNQGNLQLGVNSSSGNLDIGTGGSVIATNVQIGELHYGASTPVSQIAISGGALYAINTLGTGTLYVHNGTLLLNGGTVTVNNLVVDGYYGNMPFITFNGGAINAQSEYYESDLSAFTVGNGTNAAILNFAPGGSGSHHFGGGLIISSNATLKGIGIVAGNTTIMAGGMISPGPGGITFTNELTLSPGSTFAVTLNGTNAGQCGQIVYGPTDGLFEPGAMRISNCVLSVSLGYTPSPGDTLTIISNFTSSAILGTFVTADGMALPNDADFTVDNTIFQIDYGAIGNGFDVTLTALIPEPSSLLLTILGAVTLFALLRRRSLTHLGAQVTQTAYRGSKSSCSRTL